MKITFWGVRGSLPTPLNAQQVQAKITAAIQRITPKDIESNDARERFISKLPSWLYGTIGGNTACVTVSDEKGHSLILDAGTGLRCYGNSIKNKNNQEFNFFISHFHWDHIQGFPFFNPIYSENSKINIFSGHKNAENLLKVQQNQENFPVSFDDLKSKISFYTMEQGKEYKIFGFRVFNCKMNHPGDSYAYSFEHENKKIVYATDTELSDKDLISTPDRELVFKGADGIIIDAQYTMEEANEKENWGHSAFCNAIDFASFWGIKKIFLFHHEPDYDDKKLNTILDSAKWYAEFIVHKEIEIYLATESQEFKI